MAAVGLLEQSGIPLVAAVEDYLRARELAGSESLTAMAGEYGRLFRKIVQRVTVGQVVGEFIHQLQPTDPYGDAAQIGGEMTRSNRAPTMPNGRGMVL